MIIPIEQLEAETLKNIAQSYVLREGTDYGESEIDLETKVEQVLQQLRQGTALLFYSESEESVDIISKEDFESRIQGDLGSEQG